MPSGIVIFKKLYASDLQELAEISKRTLKKLLVETIILRISSDLYSVMLGFGGQLSNPLLEFYFTKLEGKTLGYFKINLGDAQNDFREEHADGA